MLSHLGPKMRRIFTLCPLFYASHGSARWRLVGAGTMPGGLAGRSVGRRRMVLTCRGTAADVLLPLVGWSGLVWSVWPVVGPPPLPLLSDDVAGRLCRRVGFATTAAGTAETTTN